ncbi:MAG: hypothetical protein WA136_04120 [Rhodoferax sp.]
MQTTLNLLDDALKIKDMGAWTEELKLSPKALYNSKYRGHLSPAIAGTLAEKLGQDVKQWIVIAALESEKDSACKTHLMRRITSL